MLIWGKKMKKIVFPSVLYKVGTAHVSIGYDLDPAASCNWVSAQTLRQVRSSFGVNRWVQSRSFLHLIEVSFSTGQLLSSAIHKDFPRAPRWSVLCSSLCNQRCSCDVFFPPGQHPNTPALADLWAALWTRTLPSQGRTERPAGSPQTPAWLRGESGHRGTETTWAGHTYTLLLIYLKDMVCKWKTVNCSSPSEVGECLLVCQIVLTLGAGILSCHTEFFVLTSLDFTEQRTTQQGQVYFLHTQTGVSTWHDPRVPR